MSYHINSIEKFKTIALDEEDFDRFIPEFNLDEGSVSELSKAYLDFCDEKILYLVKHGFSSIDIHHVRSQMIDKLVQNLFEKFILELDPKIKLDQAPCCLMATGGYGRQEMALLSDVDLLLVYRSDLNELCKPLIEKILYVLWDLKLEIGHAVRSISDCNELMVQDTTIFTSILDVRFLVGNKSLLVALVNARDKLLKSKSFRKSFLKSKLDERLERLKRFGGSVFLLEPHVKEGEGGLRDLQLIRWLGMVVNAKGNQGGFHQMAMIAAEDIKTLTLCLEFLFYLRNKLHCVSRRKGDQLTFDSQITIAQDLGHEDDTGTLGVEKFMQSYYMVGSVVKDQLKNMIQKVSSELGSRTQDVVGRIKSKKLDDHFKISNSKIAPIHKEVFVEDPKNLFRVFEHVQKTGFGLHFESKAGIGEYLYKVDGDFRTNPQVRQMFKSMMSNLDYLGKALFAMHDVHFFDALLPEFKRVRNRMQHDAYHVYTVDTHSIFAVQELSKLARTEDYAERFPLFKQVLGEITRLDLLSISVLLHDIGKGEGGNHSVVGAEIANGLMRRLDYSDVDREIVEFQVLSHLLMPHLSQRRDLEDPHMISEFANAMRSVDMLNMLFVLTWADIRAVSSEAWTDWKGGLLESLYRKTRAVMESELSSEEQVQQRVKDVRDAILKRMSGQVEGKSLQSFLSSMSSRYVLAHTDKEILEHFHLIMSHDGSEFLLTEKSKPKGKVSEILIYTYNNPRVIPLVTGVLLSLDINILSMENFLLSDGHVFIKMKVRTSQATTLKKSGLFERLKADLHDIFLGNRTVNELISRRKQPAFMIKKPVQQAETKITIDNDVSAHYTVIDVIAHDRLGLLYDIVKTLVENGCYVDVSKISTKVEQVVDSFYVKDIFGHKMTSKAKLMDLKEKLKTAIKGIEGDDK